MKPQETGRVARVLVVDDDDSVRKFLLRLLSNAGYTAVGVPDGTKALELLGRDWFDVALVDVQMPGSSGVDVVRAARAIAPSTRLVLMTGDSSLLEQPAFGPSAETRCVVDAYLPKPISCVRALEIVACLAGDLARHFASAARVTSAAGAPWNTPS